MENIEKENTPESFDNFYNDINEKLHNSFSFKFVDYLKNKFGDKWNCHLIFENEKYYPFTLLGTNDVILNLSNLPNNKYYYIKLRNGSYGRSIYITKNPKSFFVNNTGINNYIIQREVESELYKNRKFDYRIYLLILKKDNKILYGYYKKYVIRNCVNEMNSETDKYSKITNHHIYSLKSLDENFYILDDDFELKHQNKVFKLNEKVLKKIKECENEFYNMLKNNQYRILGVDYLVEKNTNKLYMLEINITPGVYYPDVNQDFFIKYNNFHKNIIKDLNNLIYKNLNSEGFVLI